MGSDPQGLTPFLQRCGISARGQPAIGRGVRKAAPPSTVYCHGVRPAGSDPNHGRTRPPIWPCSFSLMKSADGTRGRPGMVMISPVTTTMNSAPADNLSSRIGTVWPVGAPFLLASVENEYWVFAMHTG